jgi:hypothetical protein
MSVYSAGYLQVMVYNLLHEIVDHHCHPGAMTELKSIKCRMFRIYDTAEHIDVTDLMRCSEEARQQYARIRSKIKAEITRDLGQFLFLLSILCFTSKSLKHYKSATHTTVALTKSLHGLLGGMLTLWSSNQMTLD